MPKSKQHIANSINSQPRPGCVLFRSGAANLCPQESYILIGQNDDSVALTRLYNETSMNAILKSKSYMLQAPIQNNLFPSALAAPLFVDCSRIIISKKDAKDTTGNTLRIAGDIAKKDLLEIEKTIMVATTVSINIKSTFLPQYF